MLKYIFVLFLILGFATSVVYSQHIRESNNNINGKKGIIKGHILESETQKPMSFTNVTAYDLNTNELVSGAISDKEGFFTINEIPYGQYYIIVKLIGYEKKKVNHIIITKDSLIYDLGKIELSFSNYQTEGVEVSAEKPLIEFKMDKKVVNVDRDLISQGGSAVDALQNVPSVNVDVEGNVTLRGSSNFTVFINGKPSVLTGSDALEQIPAATIENIEIITNPSAKHDPDGIGGIINVILKKDVNLGLNGIIDLSVGTRDKYTSNILLNYQVSGFNLFAGFDYNNDTRFNEGNSNAIYYFTSGNKHIENDIDGKRKHYGNTFKGGFGLDISNASSISLEGNYGAMEFGRTHNSNLYQWVELNPNDSSFVNKNFNSRDRDFYSVNLNYIYNFDKSGHQITALAYFSNSTGYESGIQEDFITDSAWNVLQKSDYNIKTVEDEISTDYRFKADYILPLRSEDKFEAGYQLRMEKDEEQYNLEQFIVDSNISVNNPLFDNSIDFQENIHSIYTTYSGKLSSFSFMAGLRGEYTLRNIGVKDGKNNYKIDRFDWFPSLHMVQNLSTSHQITASYSRRIERPHGWDLEPFPTYFNAFTYRIGNPNLGPEYTDSYEIGYQKYFGVSYLSLESYYRVTKDKISRVRTLDGEKILLTATNLNRDYTLGVELTANYEPVKWLRLNASGSYYNYRIEGEVYDESIVKSTNVWTGNINITWMLGPNARFQTNAFYSGPTITPQGKAGSTLSWNLALRQDFFNKSTSLTLQVRDILGTMNRDFTSRDSMLYNTFFMDFESPVVTLTFSYKLNNYQKKKESGERMNGDFDDGF